MHSIYSYTLQHDTQGRITEKIETVKGTPIRWAYAYDHAGRLAEAKLDGRLVCQCRYDKHGRRSFDWFPRTHGSQIRAFRYTMENRLQAAGNNGYTHDKQGMRILGTAAETTRATSTPRTIACSGPPANGTTRSSSSPTMTTASARPSSKTAS